MRRREKKKKRPVEKKPVRLTGIRGLSESGYPMAMALRVARGRWVVSTFDRSIHTVRVREYGTASLAAEAIRMVGAARLRRYRRLVTGWVKTEDGPIWMQRGEIGTPPNPTKAKAVRRGA